MVSLNAWAAADIVIVVNHSNKVEKVSKKDVQDFYMGHNDKYETKVKAKLCLNNSAKSDFYEKIEITENGIASNKAKLLATGKNDKVITPKPVTTVDEVVEYISRNADGGLCFMKKEDFDKLKDADKKVVKVILQP